MRTQNERRNWWLKKQDIYNHSMGNKVLFFNIYLFYLAVQHEGSVIFSCSMWDLVPWPRIKPMPHASGAQSLSHWTTREVPIGLLWRLDWVTDRSNCLLPNRSNCLISINNGHSYYTEKAMAPHSSTLAWKIPWTEEPGELQSLGSQRVRHDWATSLDMSI